MATTWDPSNKSTAVTLSGNNLIATESGVVDFNNDAGRGITAITTGQKKYWEVKVNLIDTDFSTGPGIVNTSMNYTPNQWLGLTANSMGYYSSGEVYCNYTTLGTFITNSLSTYVANDIVCHAVDFAAGKIWFRVNGGNWNNDVIANQNPATGAGGINFVTSRLGSGDVYPAYNVYRHPTGPTLTQVTGNFGATAAAFSIPVGFTTFDDVPTAHLPIMNGRPAVIRASRY